MQGPVKGAVWRLPCQLVTLLKVGFRGWKAVNNEDGEVAKDVG